MRWTSIFFHFLPNINASHSLSTNKMLWFCSTPSILKTVVQFREMSSLIKDLKKDTAKLNHSGALNSLNHLWIVLGLGGFGVSKSEWPAAPSPLTTLSRKTTFARRDLANVHLCPAERHPARLGRTLQQEIETVGHRHGRGEEKEGNDKLTGEKITDEDDGPRRSHFLRPWPGWIPRLLSRGVIPGRDSGFSGIGSSLQTHVD